MQQMTARLDAIVGAEHVQDDRALLDDYALDHGDAPAHRPVAIVRPGTAEEVRQVVAWANETATPLVPVSSGGPHFHGDTVPSVPGAVMLDLRRMDKILRVDRRNRMVVIEPGVTYPQLQAALAEEGMRVTPPLLPRANKSVVASLLERQPTLIPRYNYALPEPLRDCGVVWGSGEVLFTGEAGSGSTLLETQWEAGFVQAEAKGPAQTDFYRLLTGAQGTMGVVTWASVKCELLPKAHEVNFVTAGSLGELEPLVRGLCLSRLGDELMLFDRGYLSRILAGTGTSADPDALQAWTLVLGFGGRGFRSAERVRVQREDATRLAGRLGLEVRRELPGVPVGAVDELLRGLSPAPHWKLAALGGNADIFFLTTLGRIEGYLEIMRAAVERHGLSTDSIGVYIQPQHQGVTHHVEFSLPYDPSDRPPPEDMQRALRRPGRQPHRRRRLLQPPLRLLGAARLQPRRRRARRPAQGQGDLRPGRRPEPRQALLRSARRASRARREGGPLMALTDYRPDAMRCTRCSYCKWIPFDLVRSHRFAKGCPSVEAGRFHAYSGGGKLITALSLMDGRCEATDQVVDVAFRCQLCGNCDVTCKLCRYDMEPILALREFRAHLVEMDRVPESYRPLIERTRAALAGKGPRPRPTATPGPKASASRTRPPSPSTSSSTRAASTRWRRACAGRCARRSACSRRPASASASSRTAAAAASPTRWATGRRPPRPARGCSSSGPRPA